jgi:hypothetical protein
LCLIVHNVTGSGTVPAEVVGTNLRRNPDGFGLAWREHGRLRWAKYAPADHVRFAAQLSRLEDTECEYVAHFRLATRGVKDKGMAHPFKYTDPKGDTVLVFHNGTIDIDGDPEKSDTAVFVESVLARLPHRWWHKPELRYLVERSIGWSRMLVMTVDETVYINEHAWQRESNGLRYSCDPGPRATITPKLSTGHSVPPAVIKTSVAAKSKDRAGWWHQGHFVVPDAGSKLSSLDGDCSCTQCKTMGEFYNIDGKVYIDIRHHVQLPAGRK